MRTASSVLGVIAAWSLHQAWWVAQAHPLCYFDARPTDYDMVLTFCPEQAEGACCNAVEEAGVVALYESAGTLTGTCADLYKEVVCGVCNSYSGHLYEVLGAELGSADGLTMKSAFCEELVTACDGQITFPTYEGEDYCTKHTGGGDDLYWSYPYVDEETFDADLTLLFSTDTELPTTSICMHMSPDGSVWWVGGREGMMKEISAVDLASSVTVMDLSTHPEFFEAYEQGLLDFAFGPVFDTNSRFYVSYNVYDDAGEYGRLSMFVYTPGDATATLGSEEVLVQTSVRSSSIHSGGWVGFKPSDYGTSGPHDLYWALGDSGPQLDTEQHGQNIDDLHATIVRITVPTSGTGYTIPDGNVVGGLPEICAYGFRNPWRCGFDKLTDELYCGSVGHTMVESIYIVECGNNYGWSRFEGSRCQEAAEAWLGDCAGVDRSGFEFPLYEYCHPDYDSSLASEDEFTGGYDICGDRTLIGSSVTGGYVYRGTLYSEVLYGAYVFGDYENANIYYIKQEDGEWSLGTVVSDGSLSIVSFAEDNDGELYAIGNSWQIYPMPCGDLCATTCLEQSDVQPTYTDLGCYADVVGDRALTLAVAPDCGVGSRAMSPAICASYCATISGAVYFGVEYSYQCFCGAAGEDYAVHGELEATSCSALCTAFPEYTCGGTSAIEIYSIGDAAPTPAPASLATPPSSATTEPVSGTPAPAEPVSGTPAPAEPVSGTPAPAEPVSGTPVPAEPVSGTPAPAEPVSGTPVPAEPVSPTPTSVTPSGDSIYLGCFGDKKFTTRVLSGSFVKGDSTMTAEVCAGLCEGSTYFGTEFGKECFCSAESDDLTTATVADTCNTPCSGDSAEFCGGSWAITVYEYDSTGGFTSLGCYAEDVGRVMSKKASNDAMTTEVCEGLCAGSAYFGTQFGKECWCGDASTEYDLYGEVTTCTYPCSGDDSQICGGYDTMSFYQY